MVIIFNNYILIKYNLKILKTTDLFYNNLQTSMFFFYTCILFFFKSLCLLFTRKKRMIGVMSYVEKNGMILKCTNLRKNVDDVGWCEKMEKKWNYA